MRGIKGNRQGYLIFNPVAGQDPDTELAKIRSYLEPQICFRSGGQLDRPRPPDPGPDPGDQAFEKHGEGESLIIASGGDGTVGPSPVLAGSDIPLGIIPKTATPSRCPRHSHWSEGCLHQSALGNTRQVDVALCNDQPMILLSGLGFEAGMVNKASRTENILGPMAYIYSGARQLVDQKPFKATLRIEGEEYHLDASAITVANAAPATSVMAQGFGEVIPDDGLLEVIVASPKDRMSGLSVLSSLAWSAIVSSTSHHDNIACFRTSQIEVELEESQKLVVDGEILDAEKMTVSVDPGALQVVAPIRLKH